MTGYNDPSYLTGSSQDYGPEFYYRPTSLGANYSSQSVEAPSDSGAQNAAFAGAAAAPFMATPQGAAVMVGSQFLTQYLAQKAADERARRERAAQIAQEHGQQEQKGYDTLMNAYRGALR